MEQLEQRGMRPENKKMYEKIFKMIDKDGGGSLDAEELRRALDLTGEKLTIAEVKDIIDEIDEDGNETVDMSEFMTLIENRIKDPDLLKYSYEAFKMFSETKEDHVTEKELTEILGYFSKMMTNDEKEDIMKELPWEDDKTLDIKKFLRQFISEL